jgi:hypothetical protein
MVILPELPPHGRGIYRKKKRGFSAGNSQLIDEESSGIVVILPRNYQRRYAESTGRMGFRWKLPAHRREIYSSKGMGFRREKPAHRG